MSSQHFEAAGNMKDWPPNVAGKPTQAAVFGVYHLDRGRVCEILWTGKFPDLEPAMYWAAKKEVQAVRKDKWVMASRVLWQHELTPEQAVKICHQTMKPQIDSAIGDVERDGSLDNIDIGEGPMKEVKPGEAHGYSSRSPSPTATPSRSRRSSRRRIFSSRWMTTTMIHFSRSRLHVRATIK